MATWQLQDAKAKLSEVIDTAHAHGAQIITRRGVNTAVLLPFAEWKELDGQRKPTLMEILRSGPEGDLPLPARTSWKLREPVRL